MFEPKQGENIQTAVDKKVSKVATSIKKS